MSAYLFYAATVLLVGGVVLLLLFLWQLGRRISYYSAKRRHGRPPRKIGYVAIFFAVLLLCISWVLLWSGQQLKGFIPYIPGQIAFCVDAVTHNDPVKSLEITPIAVVGDTWRRQPSVFLSDQDWFIKGQSIQIDGILAYLFPSRTAYKLTVVECAVDTPDATRTPVLLKQVLSQPATIGEYAIAIPYIKHHLRVREFVSPPLTTLSVQRSCFAIDEDGNAIMHDTTASQ